MGPVSLRRVAQASDRQIKIIYVVNDPAFFVSHRLNIARAVRDRGWNVAVATPPGPGVLEIEREGFAFLPIPLHRYSGRPITELRTLRALTKLYKRERPTLVHHVTIKPVLYGSLAARIAGVPGIVNAVSGRGQVFSAKGFGPWVRRLIVGRLYRAAFRSRKVRVIFQNESDLFYFAESKTIPLSRTKLIRGAGVDMTMFRPSTLGGLWQSSTPGNFEGAANETSTPTVLFHSRLLAEKGIREFVRASQLLADAGVRARFLIAGSRVEGNPASVSEQEIEEWKHYSNVEFAGQVKDVRPLLARADIVCLPTYYNEGVPKALVEAAAAEKPIVTTDWPGCRDVVYHGHNGLLVPPKDALALAEALQTLIVDPPLRKRLGAAGRALVMERGFSNEAVVESTLELYSDLLKSAVWKRRE